MRRTWTAIFALFGAGLTAAAFRPTNAMLVAQQSTAAQTLLRLEDGWAAAVIRRDAAYFRKYLADGFIYSEDDQTMDRETVLRELISGSDTVRAAHNEEMKVHEFGAGTAVVTGWLILEGRGSGGAFNRRYRFTDTWMRGPRGWQIVAAHDYLIPTRR